MEGLIRGASIQQTEISPLLVEQHEIGDEFRAVEKAILEIRTLMAAKYVEPTAPAEMEAGVTERTTSLGGRTLEGAPCRLGAISGRHQRGPDALRVHCRF